MLTQKHLAANHGPTHLSPTSPLDSLRSMPDPLRSGFLRPPADRLLAPGSRFQRYRWVVLVVALVLEVAVILAVYWADSELHPLDPVGGGIVFVSVVAAGLSGTLVGLITALVGVLGSFLLLADFGTPIAAANAIGSAIIWCGAAVATGLTVGYLRQQVESREAALGQALSRSLVAREKMERVLDFSPQFHRGGDLTEVARAICDTTLETFGSDGAQLHSLEGLTSELLALTPRSERILPGLTFALPDRPEVRQILQDRRPSFWPDVSLLDAKDAALEMQHELNVVSAMLVPIVSVDETVGVLSLTWDHLIERPTEELLAIMQRFADQAGIAWQAALRLEAQLQADTLRETLDRVLVLAPTFHITGTREEVAEAICEAALETFDCTAAAMYRIEGERLRVLARVPYVKALHKGLNFPLTGDMSLARELRSRAPAFVADVRDPARYIQPWPPEVIRRAGTRSALYVPIRIDEHGPRNLLVLAWDELRERPDDAYLLVVQRFTDQVALALTNASAQRLYARFEASLLPSAPVDHPRLQVVTRYRAGEQRLRLGGDFLGSMVDGATGNLHFVIGDVSGRGPDAAALGATLRSTWRALVAAEVTIPQIIAVMDEVLLAERVEPNAFATIVVGSVDLGEGSLALANVGHPPPLLITGQVTSLDTPPSPPLGFNTGRRASPWSFSLPDRWSLFCYTDGLIDVRLGPGSKERYGEARLKQRLETWTGTQPDGDTLDQLMAEIEAPSGGSFGDDVAVLLLSTKDETDSPPTAP